jgi:mRNA interferase MazF
VRTGFDPVVSCDNITTIPRAAIGRHLGYLLPAQEHSLAQAVAAAYHLGL